MTKVSFVGVDTKDSPQTAAAFLEDVGMTYLQLVDADAEHLASLGIPGLPVTVVLDAQGRVMNRHVEPLTADGLGDLRREDRAECRCRPGSGPVSNTP